MGLSYTTQTAASVAVIASIRVLSISRVFEWDIAHFPVIAKCHFCYESRILKGLGGPACADRCPTGALIFGKRGELIAEAEKRISENPGKYVDHIYGQDDAGGTSVLYISGSPLKNWGWKMLARVQSLKSVKGPRNLVLPGILVGGPLILGMVRLIAKREGWEETWPL